ncbi:MAG: hypothetical protein QW728_03655, partial [Thermoplasmata archaeon]
MTPRTDGKPPVTSITASISPAEILSNTSVNISVSVLDQDGDPVQGAYVRLYQANGILHPPRLNSYVIYQGNTSADGKFTINNATLYWAGYSLQAYVEYNGLTADALGVSVENPESFVVKVEPKKLVTNTPTDITVIVRNRLGNPIAGADVILYQSNMQIANPPQENRIGYGTTGPDGTFTAKNVELKYAGDIKLWVLVSKGNITANIGFTVEEYSAAPILIRFILFLLLLVLIPITWIYWQKYRSKTREQIRHAIKGLVKKFSNPKYGGSRLVPVAPELVFERWKTSIVELAETGVSISKNMLDSFRITDVKTGYRACLSASELVEYHGFEDVKTKMNVPFKIYTEPKPTPPDSFTSVKQAFPLTEKVHTCDRCKGGKKETCYKCTGQGSWGCSVCKGLREIECKECSGWGETNCDECGGRGWHKCSDCGGRGYTTVRKHAGYTVYERHNVTTGVTQKTKIDHGDYAASEKCSHCGGTGRWSCFTCKGKGKILCKVCNGAKKLACKECNALGKILCSVCSSTGKITCRECDGDGMMRHLHQEYWEYTI